MLILVTGKGAYIGKLQGCMPQGSGQKIAGVHTCKLRGFVLYRHPGYNISAPAGMYAM